MTDIETCDHPTYSFDESDDGLHLVTCLTCATVGQACVECGRLLWGTAFAACGRCIERGRRLVLDVIDDLDRFPHTMLEIMGLRGIRYDVSAVRTPDDDVRLPFGMDRYTEDPQDAAITAAKTPETAVGILRDWAAAWAQQLGDPPPAAGLRYLVDHTPWAIQNQGASDWQQYVDEARTVRATVRRILGITPVRANVPCPSCGGRLVREWQPRATLDTPARESSPVRRRVGFEFEGLDDTVRCTRCHHSWPTVADALKPALAALEFAATVCPDALVTVGEASRLYAGRVPSATIRSWIHRGLLVPVLEHPQRLGPWSRDGEPGERRYVLDDIEELVLRRERLAAEDAARREAQVLADQVTPV